MNRVILIGNGFDLAHGLKTDYNSFIVWYFKICLEKAFKSNDHKYEDELLSITTIHPHHHLIFSRDINKPINSISGLVDFYYEKNFKELLSGGSLYITHGLSVESPFRINIKSVFFKRLMENCYFSSWVQIENEFYSQLIFCKGTHNQNRVDTDRLTALNASMGAIIKALGEYLKTIDTSPYIEEYEKIFTPSATRFRTIALNFNYTDTMEKYIKGVEDKNPEFSFKRNYIHGKIGDEKNPLIFGFGDELDKNYHEMELTNVNSFFKYIKSFWYLNTVNYSALRRFLSDDTYEVLILGHSCGLSDRTLLNTLFEHPKCSSVKIFYYQNENGNNFTELTYEISRHFPSKKDLRNKVVPFPKCQSMPQLGDKML